MNVYGERERKGGRFTPAIRPEVNSPTKQFALKKEKRNTHARTSIHYTRTLNRYNIEQVSECLMNVLNHMNAFYKCFQ